VVGPEFDREWSGDAFALDDWLLPMGANGYRKMLVPGFYSPIQRREAAESAAPVCAGGRQPKQQPRGGESGRLVTLRDMDRSEEDTVNRVSKERSSDSSISAETVSDPVQIRAALPDTIFAGGSAGPAVAKVGIDRGSSGGWSIVISLESERERDYLAYLHGFWHG